MIEKTIKIEGHLDYFIEQIAIRYRKCGYVQLIENETNLALEAEKKGLLEMDYRFGLSYKPTSLARILYDF